MDRRDTMALSILTTLIMEPAPPEGYDWVINQLTEHLPEEAPHRYKLAKASVLMADTLLECLNDPPEIPNDWAAPEEVPTLEDSGDDNSISPVEVGNLNTDD